MIKIKKERSRVLTGDSRYLSRYFSDTTDEGVVSFKSHTDSVPQLHLYHGSCSTVMDMLIKDCTSVDYIITSPPYNRTTKRMDCYYNNGYAFLDNLSEQDYIDTRIAEFKQFEKLLSKNGLIIYNLSYGSDNPSLPIKLIYNVISNTEFEMVDIITWKKRNAIPFQTSPRKLSRICEYVYIFARKEDIDSYVTNKIISKINKNTGQHFYKNYTNFIRAANNDKIKTSHKATFSTELVEKLIDTYVPFGKTVPDPFMGIGTTGIACINTNRNFIGIELLKEHFDVAKDRNFILLK